MVVHLDEPSSDPPKSRHLELVELEMRLDLWIG
jgi:hypothetical protein